jgi:hypothetical protein
MVPSEDSNSGLSSAASVGTSQCIIEPLHASASSSKNLSQMVPHVQTKNAFLLFKEDFSQALTVPHADSASLAPNFHVHYSAPAQHGNSHVSILGPKASTSQHKWKSSPYVQAVCQLNDKNKVHNIPMQSVDSSHPYPLINDPMCLAPCSTPTPNDLTLILFPLILILQALYTLQLLMGFSIVSFHPGPIITTTQAYLGPHHLFILARFHPLLNQLCYSPSPTIQPI